MKRTNWKKMLVVATVAGILLVGGTVYAATSEELKQERYAAKQAALTERVESGRITQEQADALLAKIQTRMAECDGTCDGTGSADADRLRMRDGSGTGGGFGLGNGNAGAGAGAGGFGSGVCDGSGQATGNRQ